MQGETLSTYVDSGVIYPEVKKNPSSIYSFLLVAGYLRCTKILPQDDGNFMCQVSIPNKEIAFVYAKEIISRLNLADGESTAAAIQQAVFEKEAAALQKSIEKYLLETISVYDTGSEAFYQGLMIGLCAILNNRYMVRSNRESGFGRFDIQLCPLEKGLPGLVFELKAATKGSESLDKLATEAIQHIEEKHYETEMRASGIQEVLKFGMAFRGKEIVVRTE
jgi:hypothetical protein